MFTIPRIGVHVALESVFTISWKCCSRSRGIRTSGQLGRVRSGNAPTPERSTSHPVYIGHFQRAKRQATADRRGSLPRPLFCAAIQRLCADGGDAEGDTAERAGERWSIVRRPLQFSCPDNPRVRSRASRTGRSRICNARTLNWPCITAASPRSSHICRSFPPDGQKSGRVVGTGVLPLGVGRLPHQP